MNIHDATEKAYRNGYAKGKADALAADVVEVVRCRECRHSEICPDRILWCNECNMLADPDGYCYRGERREVCEKD